MRKPTKNLELTPPLVQALKRVVSEVMDDKLAKFMRQIQPSKLMRRHEFARQMNWPLSYVDSLIAQGCPHIDETPPEGKNRRIFLDPEKVREWMDRRAEP